MLDLITLMIEKGTVEHIMHLVHLGLIVELGEWKKKSQKKEDD